jgi:hypothetical protein
MRGWLTGRTRHSPIQMIVRVANGHSRTLSGAGRVEEARHNYPDLTVSKFKQAMVFSPPP